MDKPITLITGTSNGIGKALKEYYMSQNHFVIGCSRGQVDNIEGGGKSYKHFTVDICNENEILEMFKTIKKEYKKLDNLINNAGIMATNLAMITPIDTLDKVINTNYRASFIFCIESIKLMKKNKYGRIINFSSISVPMRQMGELIYTSSKSAVEMMSMILAKEIAHYGITVNVIAPSLSETEMISHLSSEQKEQIFNKLAIKQYSSFDDIINVIDFYLSPKSSMVTGQKIYLGGIS